MAVGAEGEHDAELVGEADLLVAEVEAVRGAVDLEGGAGAGGRPVQRLQVDVAGGPAADAAAGGVADDVDGRVLAGGHEPGREGLAGLVEPVVDAGHEHVEAVEELVVVVERPVPADVELGPVEQRDVAQAPLQGPDALPLGQQLGRGWPRPARGARRGR